MMQICLRQKRLTLLKKVQTISESLSAMKADNESEAQRIVAPETKGKPQTLADACLAMKDENLAEAQRLVPDRGSSDRTTK